MPAMIHDALDISWSHAISSRSSNHFIKWYVRPFFQSHLLRRFRFDPGYLNVEKRTGGF